MDTCLLKKIHAFKYQMCFRSYDLKPNDGQNVVKYGPLVSCLLTTTDDKTFSYYSVFKNLKKGVMY